MRNMVIPLSLVIFVVIFLFKGLNCKRAPAKRNIPKAGWSASSNYRGDVVKNAFDGDPKTRWDTGAIQTPGMYLELNLGEPYRVSQIIMDLGDSLMDYPRKLKIETSLDMNSWTTLLDGITLQPVGGKVSIPFEERAMQGIRLTQLGNDPRFWWSIHELTLLE